MRIHALPGACFEAIPCRLLEVSTSDDFQITFFIYISSDHVEGCHSWTGASGLFDVCDWTKAQGVEIISFWYDGSIKSRIGNLGTYTYDTWYKIKMVYERKDISTINLSYWIDDNLVGSQNVSAASYEDDLLFLHYSSGDGTIWIDDIQVCYFSDVIINGITFDDNSAKITNAWFPLSEGETWKYKNKTTQEIIYISGVDTQIIYGVNCLRVAYNSSGNVNYAWFAQDTSGDIHYFKKIESGVTSEVNSDDDIPNYYLLSNPIVGSNWSWTFDNHPTVTSTVESTSEIVNTGEKEYTNCLKIVEVGSTTGDTLYTYYATGIGLVRHIDPSGNIIDRYSGGGNGNGDGDGTGGGCFIELISGN